MRCRHRRLRSTRSRTRGPRRRLSSEGGIHFTPPPTTCRGRAAGRRPDESQDVVAGGAKWIPHFFGINKMTADSSPFRKPDDMAGLHWLSPPAPAWTDPEIDGPRPQPPGHAWRHRSRTMGARTFGGDSGGAGADGVCNAVELLSPGSEGVNERINSRPQPGVPGSRSDTHSGGFRDRRPYSQSRLNGDEMSDQ